MSTNDHCPSQNPAGRGPHTSKEERMADLEARLETYKSTLTEIYQLYDTKIEELSLIRRIGDSLRTHLDLRDLCREIVDVVAQEITADRLALLLLDEEEQTLRLYSSYDSRGDRSRFFEKEEARTLDCSSGPTAEAIRTG